MVTSSEAVDDGLNLDHLRLPQYSAKSGKTKTGAVLAKRKLNELFIHWLTQPETQEQVHMLLQEENRENIKTIEEMNHHYDHNHDHHHQNSYGSHVRGSNISESNSGDYDRGNDDNDNNDVIGSPSSKHRNAGLTLDVLSSGSGSPEPGDGDIGIKGPLANVWNTHNTQPPRSPTNTPKHNPFGSPSSEHKTSKKNQITKREQEITMEYPASPVSLPEGESESERRKKQKIKEKEKEEIIDLFSKITLR
eukprot:gb/GECH01001357.1/.p1 GENE.gb/GECH01001357.1/~~gb/GECH01001357.1/.p1  ORF type:complete len:249 (+),score=53.38 gb/GECH01001357.1/:1-747(+)